MLLFGLVKMVITSITYTSHEITDLAKYVSIRISFHKNPSLSLNLRMITFNTH